MTLIERRNAFELMRDQAANLFEAETGSAWRPRSGSMLNHRNMTAAMIDSRDFIMARRRAETELLLPQGVVVARLQHLAVHLGRRLYDARQGARGWRLRDLHRRGGRGLLRRRAEQPLALGDHAGDAAQ